MKIVLHGATDCGSSNYGDFLYGKMIYDFLISKIGLKPDDISFYNPSDFFKKYIDSTRLADLQGNLKDADVGIYIPGGYFGEGHNASWKETFVQMKRFIPFGLKCIFKKKPFAVIGVGAGPNNNELFKKMIKFVIRRASVVTVRDQESFNALKKIGCDNMQCCSDAIVAFEMKTYDANLTDNKTVSKIISELNKKNKKGLLVHFNHSIEAAQKFGEAVRLFVEKNEDYCPVISSDQLLATEDGIVEVFEKAYNGRDYLRYEYEDPYEFGSLISNMGFILTAKLHVGVTAVAKGKPTLAVAVHPEKTERFYKQIKAEQDYLNLDIAKPEQIAQRMNDIKGTEIKIPEDVVLSAKNNLIRLKSFINDNRK